jgi:hypothetical protein
MSRVSSSAIVLFLSVVGCTGTIEGGADGDRPPSDPDDPNGDPPPGQGGNGGSGGNGAQACQVSTPTPPRLWRLTHRQFRNTVTEAFGFSVPALETLPGESRLDGFANAAERLALSPTLFEYYSQGAEAVGAEVVKRSGDFLRCPLASLGTGTCLADFVSAVGRKAWRRPLAPAEVTRLTKLYQDTAGGDPEVGLSTVVQALILSTNFIYRTELGTGDGSVATTLTDVELASALSYLLWDGPPDAGLMTLAEAGKLHPRATLLAEAKRLLGTTTKAPPALFSFVQQWLETEDLTEKPKDMATFPIFDREVARQLEEETRTLLDEVVFDAKGDRNLRSLLTASHGFVSAKTAKIYDVPAPAGSGLVRTELDPTRRRGLLTQGSFLAAHAEPINTSVVGRGRFIREEILCDDVPPPPGEFKFDEKVITDDMTAREKFTEHAKNPACAACHRLFDTIGFALENYDAIGAYRKTDKNKTIDPSGALTLPSGADIKFTNLVDLVNQLADGPDTYACFASQYTQYATGRVKLDECERDNMVRAFKASGYKVDALIMALVGSPGFVNRKN